tara:strand:+ start:83 stop:1075 length:993 start_codon:yes stop_codon:yes gene_type:complete
VINNILSKPKGPFSAEELSKISDSSIIGNKDTFISNISSLKDATKGEITFVDNPKYIKQILKTKASGLIISDEYISKIPKLDILFVSKNPYLSYAKVVEKFYPLNKDYSYTECKNKNISNKSKLSDNCTIYNNVTIKANSIISANSSIGPNVFIGKNCYVGRNVSISNSYLEDNIVIQDGSVIGQDGFGYAYDNNKYIKIPQIGIVKIGCNVEIGCNCTVDRGSLKYTEIREGVKIDNLVHIAHNVVIKENTVIAGQTGIAGSAIIGRNVMIGGQVGIAGHIKVGNNVKIGAQAGVTKNIDDGKSVSGTPAVDLNLYLKKSIILNKMVKK